MFRASISEAERQSSRNDYAILEKLVWCRYPSPNYNFSDYKTICLPGLYFTYCEEFTERVVLETKRACA